VLNAGPDPQRCLPPVLDDLSTNTMSVSQYARSKRMVVYEAPSNPVAYGLWRVQMWAESTFALSMMERWEKVLICESFDIPKEFSVLIDAGGLVVALTLVFVTGLVQYLPHHLRFVARRAAYYLLGREAELSELLTPAKGVVERGEL
jgi:hypothetical protein